MNTLQIIFGWLWARLAEKTTQTALVGLLTVSLSYLKIPADLQPVLATFLVTFFFGVAVTKG